MARQKVYTGDPAGRVTGTVEFIANKLSDPLQEHEVLSIPWRSALDVYLGSDTLLPSLEGMTTRVYVQCANSRALVSQNILAHGSQGAQALHPPNLPIQAQSNPPLARARSWGGDQLIVTLQGFVQSDPAARIKLNYCAYGWEPCAEPDSFTVWPQYSANSPEFALLGGAGRLHNLWITNFDNVDRWAWLFDTGPSDPNFATFPAAGMAPIIPPVWLPPNAKGAAFLDFNRPRGLWPRFGLLLSNSTSATTFTRDLTANINMAWEVS